jgi:hypothetical protein
LPRRSVRKEPSFKPSYSELSKITTALKKENAKLQKRIVIIEINDISQKNKIAAFMSELENRPSLSELISSSLAKSLLKVKKKSNLST